MTIDAVGGVWRYAMDLGASLRTAGIEVVYAGLGPAPSPDQASEAKSIGQLRWLDAPLDWTAEDERVLDEIPALLSKLIDDHGIDFLHLNLPSQACGLNVELPVVVVSHSCVVTWFHAVRGTPTPDDWQWQKRRNRAGFNAADAVLAPSHSHAAMLRICYGPIDGLRIVHNAATNPLPPLGKEDFVFAAGRWWDEGKNARVLDSAAATVEWPVVMAGPTAALNGHSVELPHARQLGEIPNAQVRGLMRRAGIVVSPSIYEPFGLAALEAAHAQAALVLADIPTYRELWDGAAIFADPYDPKALAVAINGLAAEPGTRRRFGELAFERAQRFSPTAQTQAMLDVYGTVLVRSNRTLLPAE
jgi:glycosyltransferase involved in cell wall biosynthesis